MFEQLRDPSKAGAFLKAYIRESPGDTWAEGKVEHLASLGVV